MPIDVSLHGAIFPVTLEEQLSDSMSSGMYEGIRVFVNYARNRIGQTCLVKTDLYPMNTGAESLRANFISSSIASDFSLTVSTDYILLGLWDKKTMGRPGRVPFLDEINHYYNPGEMKFCGFIKSSNTSKRGRFIIDKNGPKLRKVLLKELITENLPDPKLATRCAYAQDIKGLEAIRSIVIDMGLMPIEMETFI